MSSKISLATAYSNGEVAYISWQINAMIPGCLGFEITRVFPDDPTQNKKLASWVPFDGQSNPNWLPQDTSVWPVQKLNWRDVTLIKSRDQLASRPGDFRVQYLIRPLVKYDASLEKVDTTLPITYTGTAIPLSYVDKGQLTNIITITTQYGKIRSTFTNGILATQWLSNVLKKAGAVNQKTLMPLIKQPGNPVREYLTGDVLETVKMLLVKAKETTGSTVKMAIYEFDDTELYDTLIDIKDQVEIVLSNTSMTSPNVWDTENNPFRMKLHNAGIKIYDRFFNNSTSIGHNKFAIYLENGVAKSVMMGSTNWTPNGLCAQSNNASVIDVPEIAEYYNQYFEALKTDNNLFTVPNPTSAPTKNIQGSVFRNSNIPGNAPITLADGTTITAWFSPNTPGGAKNNAVMPPDLAAVYSLMRKAEHAVFFAVFMPGVANNATKNPLMTNVITEAISIAEKDNSLLVYGAISEAMAMPNFPVSTKTTDADATGTPKAASPTTYDTGNIHIVRASGITDQDKIGNFQNELLNAGFAIIHDKIVVIDPFSDGATVIFGSHNLGFKASYDNDENLIIVQNNPALVQAFAIHVLDIYEHYRFRAVLQETQAAGKNQFDGFLSTTDSWLSVDLSEAKKGSLSDYMCSGVFKS